MNTQQKDQPLTIGVTIKGDKAIIDIILHRHIRPTEIKEAIQQLKEKEQELYGKVFYVGGRAPIWLYGSLVHYLSHLGPIVSVFDPKLRGYVVVASHIPEIEEGTIITP